MLKIKIKIKESSCPRKGASELKQRIRFIDYLLFNGVLAPERGQEQI
jgi:hypothetical protein